MAPELRLSEQFIVLFNNLKKAAGLGQNACGYSTRIVGQFVMRFMPCMSSLQELIWSGVYSTAGRCSFRVLPGSKLHGRHLLDDAVRAYVFGAPAAAIAMCRAAYDMVRKEHYKRGELQNVVIHASREYDFINDKNIKELVKSANRVLHNYANNRRLNSRDDEIIINFLLTVKRLIKLAPKR